MESQLNGRRMTRREGEGRKRRMEGGGMEVKWIEGGKGWTVR